MKGKFSRLIKLAAIKFYLRRLVNVELQQEMSFVWMSSAARGQGPAKCYLGKYVMATESETRSIEI